MMRERTWLIVTATVAPLWCFCSFIPVAAYPEFQSFSEKHSGRTTDCSMCHTNSAGPTGTGVGQIGSLKPEEFKKLTEERTAMEPGIPVDSPILNRFGNQIIKQLGRKEFLSLRAHPEGLAKALGSQSDLDNDGIDDGQEYMDGTDPLNASHGDPGKLFRINLDRNKVHILLAAGAISLLTYGFMQLLHGFAAVAKARRAAREFEDSNGS